MFQSLESQRWTTPIQSCFYLKQRWFFFQLWTALIQKIRDDQLWNRVDQHWSFSCSLNQRWKTSNLWNSADYLWDFNPGDFKQNKFRDQVNNPPPPESDQVKNLSPPDYITYLWLIVLKPVT